MTEIPAQYWTGREPPKPKETAAEELVRLLRELIEEAKSGRERLLTAQEVA